MADVLKGLGFSLADQQRQTEEFSGGWQMRIALAKLLLARPNLLLMDEPTNHLDLPARNWLEEYLHDYPGSVVLVSHDRYFLDATVQAHHRGRPAHAHRLPRQLLEVRGRARGAHGAPARGAPPPERRRSRRPRPSSTSFRYQATKARQVQSRIKQLDKVERIEIPPERKKIRFKFPDAPKPGRVVLELKGVRKRLRRQRRARRSVDLMIERGDRIALVGPNGAGKSTLMRILAGVDQPDRRACACRATRWCIDYFAQDQAAVLNPTRTVYEEMTLGQPDHDGAA